MSVSVGVLALQGGFLEHLSLLHRSATHLRNTAKDTPDITLLEVRNPQDLARCDALIIPGGESTTIALIAAQSGLLEPLRAFVKTQRKPTWGTCAGLILLSAEANAAKTGGQDLIGGLAVRVRRNHFGRQIESFVADVALPFLAQSAVLSASDATAPFPGVFIRAPIVEKLLLVEEAEAGDVVVVVVQPGEQVGSGEREKVEILGVLPDRTKRVEARGGPGDASGEVQGGELNNIVAVRQGNILGTSFHPELTDDIRIHVWWLEQVLKSVQKV